MTQSAHPPADHQPALHMSALTKFSVGWTKGFTSKRYLGCGDGGWVGSLVSRGMIDCSVDSFAPKIGAS